MSENTDKIEALFLAFAIRTEAKIEELKPGRIGPYWIKMNLGKRFFRRITSRLESDPTRKGRKNWTPFTKHLSPASQGMWHQEIPKELSFMECVTNVLRMLRKNKPETFHSEYIAAHCPEEYERLRKKYLKQRKNGIRVWKPLLAKLPKVWQEKWVPLRAPDTLAVAIKKIKAQIRKDKPETFSPQYFFLTCRKSYDKVRAAMPWSEFKKKLDPDMRKRFTFREKKALSAAA